jgi:hypothetical protein|tara:strand:+ start:2155 stop:2472 length:318 start_codon:yes stop_codon:yes gene_type:complete
MPLPDDNDVEKVIERCKDVNLRYAQAKSKVTTAKEYLKIARYKGLPREGTALEREAIAHQTPEYLKAVEDLGDAVFEETLAFYDRRADDMIFDAWRTTCANERKI